MKKITKSRGFTLIELLVVIAIIGILAAIVLASLSTARTKATAAKVEGQLDEMRNAAEIYYSTNGSYATAASACVGGQTGLFNDTASGMQALVNSTASTTGGYTTMDCGTNYSSGSATAWSVAATLPGGGVFCVDSTGAARQAATSTGNAYSTLLGAEAGATPGAHVAAGYSFCN